MVDSTANTDGRLVVAGTFLTPMEAELAHGALESAGIEAMVAADDAGGLRPGMWMSGVRLLVRAEDAERASALLRAPGLGLAETDPVR